MPLARTHTDHEGRAAASPALARLPSPATRVQHPGGARPTLPSALPPPPTSPLTHTHVHTTHAHIRRQLGTENPRRAFWRHKCNIGLWLHLCTCFLWVWRSVAPAAVLLCLLSGFDGADVVHDNDRILRLYYCYHRYRTMGRCAITLIVIAIIIITSCLFYRGYHIHSSFLVRFVSDENQSLLLSTYIHYLNDSYESFTAIVPKVSIT